MQLLNLVPSLFVLKSQMPGLRVAFANSTNSSNSIRFLPKLGSRKSAPTCTISLANVSSDLCINIPSSPPATSLIPFPSSSDISISQPDHTCLSLLRSPSDSLLRPGSQERRKRSTARPLQPPTPETTNQPPRKRPRLQKSGKSRKHTFSSDLRFLAMVQRSVASGVMERQAGGRSPPPEQSLEMQDRLLASRLRSHLLDKGLKEADVVDLDDLMDVDGKMNSPSVAVDMDIDVETSAGCRVPSSFSSCRPSQSRSTLVATLIIRHQTRSVVRSERIGGTRERVRRPSPLTAYT